MSKTRKVVIIVEAQLPKDIGTVEFRDYVDDAVHIMCKSSHPPGGDDGLDPRCPLFNVNKHIKKVYFIGIRITDN